MTVSEMLFGTGKLAPTNAAWGRVFGTTRQTISKKKKCPGTITLDELAQIAQARNMSAEEIGAVVLNWMQERNRSMVIRKRA